MQIVITKLIWDAWNTEHIRKHNIKPEEVEQSLQDIFVVFMMGHSGRVLALGRSRERLIATVLHRKAQEYEYYVVTARDMSKREREFYQKHRLSRED